MLNNNNSAMENLYSVNYVENFLDVMENMPDEVQRDITKMRELDVNYQELLNDLDSIVKNFQSASNNEISAIKKILVELQDKLILSQELADDKIASVQHMLDVIEGKQTILDTDQRKLGNECKVDNERNDVSLNDRGDCERSAKRPRRTPRADVPSISSIASIAATISSAISNSTVPNPQSSPSSSSGHNHGVDRLMRQDSPLSERGSNIVSSSSRGNSTRNSVQKRVVTKKKKRRSRMDKDREDSPPDMPIDPDEPTYCLCEQVSYGDMIGCDNDLCPIEWFHFSCVNLIHKPKGKWYCPKCGGDKATVMKPKSVLNKELMQYNKEKEERS